MTATAFTFFCVGATVLWGGLLFTLGITIYNEKKEKSLESR